MATLEFGGETRIESGVELRQASDGTVFYVKDEDESSIYVLYNGKKVTATNSWDGDIAKFCSECFGNALYFITRNKKIYTAIFRPPSEIQITCIRELANGETYNFFMLISRKRNGKEVIYRACDDPTNGIIVDVPKEKLVGCDPQAVHRGKLIYRNTCLDEGTAIHLSPNIIVVKCGRVDIFANDDSPLVYTCQYDWKSLFAIDTTTMETLSIKLPNPVCNSTTAYYYNIVGVHGGQINVRRVTGTKVGDIWERTDEICNANFPEALKHFERAAVERDQTGYVKEKRRRVVEERRFAELQETTKKLIPDQVDQKMHLINDEMNQLRLRMDELERENTELKDQLAESNGKYQKLLMMLRTMEKFIFRLDTSLIINCPSTPNTPP